MAVISLGRSFLMKRSMPSSNLDRFTSRTLGLAPLARASTMDVPLARPIMHPSISAFPCSDGTLMIVIPFSTGTVAAPLKASPACQDWMPLLATRPVLFCCSSGALDIFSSYTMTAFAPAAFAFATFCAKVQSPLARRTTLPASTVKGLQPYLASRMPGTVKVPSNLLSKPEYQSAGRALKSKRLPASSSTCRMRSSRRPSNF
mmetsp:Transcript_50/g.160  ORF Transcript_50/g.160 Transcript_50/m.160 type:complete len:203 (-) Transcript_50:382-990(-)